MFDGMTKEQLINSIKACAHHPNHDCESCDYCGDNFWCYNDQLIEDFETLMNEPKTKTGHWVVLDFCANKGIYCSECHMKIFDMTTKPKKKLSQYCSHCGSRNEQFFRDGEVVFR